MALAAVPLLFVVAPASQAGAVTIPAKVPSNVAVTDTQPLSYQGPSLVSNPTDPSDLAISYQEGAQEQNCYLALSNNGGRTWRDEALIGPQGQFPLPSGYIACLRMSDLYAPDGTLYYAFTASMAAASGPHPTTIFLTSSTNNGATFSTPVPIDTKPLAQPANVGDQEPRMAVDPNSGKLYVTWQQVVGKFASEAVLVASSTNKGQTFSNPVQISTAAQTTVGLETVAVDSAGRVYVDFSVSLAGGPVAPALSNLVEVAYSTDGGQTFNLGVAMNTAICLSGCPTGLGTPLGFDGP
ncbi:MAG: sialidase family protein, partial [Acidimicrobiales bacterium]